MGRPHAVILSRFAGKHEFFGNAFHDLPFRADPFRFMRFYQSIRIRLADFVDNMGKLFQDCGDLLDCRRLGGGDRRIFNQEIAEFLRQLFQDQDGSRLFRV